MNLEQLKQKGLIEPIQADIKQVTSNLSRAKKDLTTAKSTLDIDEEWTYTICYHAMLRAGRALMLGQGYRPKGKDQHKTVVTFCSIVLGSDYKTLTNKFDRMRRKRHHFIYEPDRPIPYSEAEQSIIDAEKLIAKIIEIIQHGNPQTTLEL